MNNNKQQVQPLFTLEDAASFLKVHPETVRRWYLKEGLKGYKKGRTLRFRQEDLLEFLGRQK